MIHILTTTLLLFETGFLTAVSIEVQAGHNVTMWCEHTLHVSGDLYWLKQVAGAVPIIIVYMLYTESSQSVKPKYFNNFTKDHMIIHHYRKNTSLRIINVTVSDSGFYFCGAMDYHWMFGNGTKLEVKENVVRKTEQIGTETFKKDYDKFPVSTESCSERVFFNLTLLFGGIIIFTFTILLIVAIIRQHNRTKHRKVAECQEQQHDKEQEPEPLQYSAVYFSKLKPRTAEGHTNTNVLYTDAT